MRVKCLSIRLESLTRISDKAFKAIAFDGSEAIIPSSQVYGEDYDVIKSNAYWISEWILEKKSIQYSRKKIAWFDSETKKILPTYIVEEYTPDEISKVDNNIINDLKK